MMEWVLLAAVGLGVAGWVLVWRFYRNQQLLKRLLGESVILTQTAIDQNQTLIDHNQTLLNDLTRVSVVLMDTTQTVTETDPTITTTLH